MDLRALAREINDYMTARLQTPLLARYRDDERFVDLDRRVESEQHAIYAAILSGELSRNDAIILFLPLAEKMARGQTKLTTHLASDLESVAHVALCNALADLPTDIDKLYGWLVKKLQNKLSKYKKKERNAERYKEDGSEVDADTMAAPTTDAGLREELEVVCRDDIDKTILWMRADGYDNKEIGEATGLSTRAVSLRLRKMEGRYYDDPLRSYCQDSIDDQIIAMRVNGKSDSEIARVCGINPVTVGARMETLRRRREGRADDMKNFLGISL